MKDVYENKLLEVGVKLLDSYRGAKIVHVCQCIACGGTWSTKPLTITQTFKKWGTNGCPSCKQRRVDERNTITRRQNIQTLVDRGLTIVSDWTGQRVSDSNNSPVPVSVHNPTCGHTFTSNAVNLLTRNLTCTRCGIKERSTKLTQTSHSRSEEWQKTASEWKMYKSTVTKLTRISYNQNKHTINPTTLPTGRAGTEGAYHLDHIVPIRFCYDNNIPEESCAHYTNLQMLGWRENVGSRDKIKGVVPQIFERYIK